MTEIDFIPSRYHRDRQRRIWFRQRYATIVLALAVWSVGTMLAGRFIARAHGQLAALQDSYEKGLRKVDLANQMEVRLMELTQKTQMLERLCPRTNVSAVLAELTARVGERVLLSNLQIAQMPVEPETSDAGGASGSAVRLGGTAGGKPASALPQEAMCSSVVLTGIAANAGDVANLIARLEESDYFSRVSPRFSRNKEMEEENVTEFEVECIVSDFIIDR